MVSAVCIGMSVSCRQSEKQSRKPTTGWAYIYTVLADQLPSGIPYPIPSGAAGHTSDLFRRGQAYPGWTAAMHYERSTSDIWNDIRQPEPSVVSFYTRIGDDLLCGDATVATRNNKAEKTASQPQYDLST